MHCDVKLKYELFRLELHRRPIMKDVISVLDEMLWSRFKMTV